MRVGDGGLEKHVPGLEKVLGGRGLDNRVIFKTGYAEKIGSNGNIKEPEDAVGNYLKEVLDLAKGKGGLLNITGAELAAGQTARLLLMPISAMPAVGLKERLSGTRGTGSINANRDDVAVCWSHRVVDAEVERQIGGVVVMAVDEARKFYEEVAADPTRFLEMTTMVNGGPVIGREGMPLEEANTKALVVLPNKVFGGKLRTKVVSRPFELD